MNIESFLKVQSSDNDSSTIGFSGGERTPERMQEIFKEVVKYIKENMFILNTFAKDTTLKFKIPGSDPTFSINLEKGEINVPIQWFLEKEYKKEQILWACLHEISHFREMIEDLEGEQKMKEHILEKAREAAVWLEERLRQKYQDTHPDYIAGILIKKKNEQIGEDINKLEMACYKYYFTLYNVLRDVFVNTHVSRMVGIYDVDEEGGQQVVDLYQKLFPKDLRFLPQSPETEALGLEPKAQPRHMQFIFKIIRDEMIKEEEAVVCEEVEKAFKKKYFYTGKAFTIQKFLDDFIKPRRNRDTKLSKRLEASIKVIEPIFDNFLYEDIMEIELPDLPPPPEKSEPGEPGEPGEENKNPEDENDDSKQKEGDGEDDKGNEDDDSKEGKDGKDDEKNEEEKEDDKQGGGDDDENDEEPDDSGEGKEGKESEEKDSDESMGKNKEKEDKDKEGGKEGEESESSPKNKKKQKNEGSKGKPKEIPSMPFEEFYEKFDENEIDKIDPKQLEEYAQKIKEIVEEESKKAEQEERSSEQIAQQIQSDIEREFLEQTSIPKPVYDSFKRIQEEVSPYLEELSQLWEKIIYGSTKGMNYDIEGHFRQGEYLDIKKVVKDFPAIQRGNFEAVKPYKKIVESMSAIEKPELIRIRLVGDTSGSMAFDGGKKIEALRKIFVLVLSSLFEFEKKLESFRSQTKSKTRVSTEAWGFNDSASLLKKQREDSGLEEQKSVIEAFARLVPTGGTVNSNVLYNIADSLPAKEKSDVKEKKILDIVLEITDGVPNPNDIGRTVEAIKKLDGQGQIIRSFYIGNDEEEIAMFNAIWNPDESNPKGEIVGYDIAKLMPAIVKALKEYLSDVRI